MSAKKPGHRALGRGLDALFQEAPGKGEAAGRRGSVFSCPIERLAPRRDQPRKHFDTEALEALAATIAAHGVIQPLVVRRTGDDRYEIIAGERRWRAAQRAGLKEVPVVVKDVSSDTAFELALVENVQREDLNPIEVAEAYRRLVDDLGHSQEQVATRVGKSRVAVVNTMRLLKLPDGLRRLVASGELSEGHGRALLGAPDPDSMTRLATLAVRGQVSVRKLEGMVRRAKKLDGTRPGPASPEGKSPNTRDLELRMQRRLGARVTVEHRGKSGRIVIDYGDLDELDRLLAILAVD